MKKTSLLAATALFTVMLASGLAQAESTTATTAATAATTAATQTMKDKMPMKGMMAKPAMSEASRKLMQDAMEKVKTDNKATYDQIEAKHKELQEIVKAPTFDKSAFTAKHEEIQTLHHKMGAAKHAAMADVFEKMTPEERGQFGMGRGMHGGMGKHDGMGMGMMGANPKCPMMDDNGDMPAKAAPAAKK